MHKFCHTAPESAVSDALRRARRENASWGEFARRDIIRDNLLAMQENRCAYCERCVDGTNGHIEHFRKRSSKPQLCFAWENLFYSCMAEKTCGKWKDNHAKPNAGVYALLLDPRKDDIEAFLVFTANGGVSPRDGLSENDQKRANETTRVFHLDEPGLVRERLNFLKSWSWLLQENRDEIGTLLENSTQGKPFITALYHLVGRKVTP